MSHKKTNIVFCSQKKFLNGSVAANSTRGLKQWTPLCISKLSEAPSIFNL